MTRVKVALMSCGLGHVRRGFEVSAAQWNSALQTEPGLELRLFSGGSFPSAEVTPNCGRDGRLAKTLRRLNLIHDGCRLEQITFGVGVLRSLVRWKPDVIWLQELTLARLLAVWRRIFRLSYRIVFCNGAPVGVEDYRQFDFIQHLNPGTFEAAKRDGISAGRMQVLPHCTPLVEVAESKEKLREAMGYGPQDWVVLCVAAWNRHHKRIDYLIEEVAKMNDPQVHLLLCGQPEAETPGLKELGERLLGSRVRWMTLPPEEVFRVMRAADVFVLPSLNEALGAVLVEAAMSGLPIFTHRHPAAEYVLQDELWLGDLSTSGTLSRRLAEWKKAPPPVEVCRQLQVRAAQRFSAQALAPQFRMMIQSALSERPA